jgi:hypothetical protein
MTEAEWVNEQQRSQGMVWTLRGTRVTRTKAGKRKLRLFACACCRLVWDVLNEPLLRQSVEVAERVAEGQSGKDQLEKAYMSAREWWLRTDTPAAMGDRENVAIHMAVESARPNAFSAAFDMTAYPRPLPDSGTNGIEFEPAHCELLRCVFGNPFRHTTLDPVWRTPAVAALAQETYDERHLPSGHLDPTRLGRRRLRQRQHPRSPSQSRSSRPWLQAARSHTRKAVRKTEPQ